MSNNIYLLWAIIATGAFILALYLKNNQTKEHSQN